MPVVPGSYHRVPPPSTGLPFPAGRGRRRTARLRLLCLGLIAVAAWGCSGDAIVVGAECGSVDRGRSATTSAWATLTETPNHDTCFVRAVVTCTDGKTHVGRWTGTEETSIAQCPTKYWISTEDGVEFAAWSWEFGQPPTK